MRVPGVTVKPGSTTVIVGSAAGWVGAGVRVGVWVGVGVRVGVTEIMVVGVGPPEPTFRGFHDVSMVRPKALATRSNGTYFWFEAVPPVLEVSWTTNKPLGNVEPSGKLVTSRPSVPVVASIVPFAPTVNLPIK